MITFAYLAARLQPDTANLSFLKIVFIFKTPFKNAPPDDRETNHINNAAFFLCSDDASYINGHTMLVDFGSLMEYKENN